MPIIKFRSPKIPEITVCRVRNTKVVLLPENGKSSRAPETAVPVLKLRTTRERKSSRLPETAVPGSSTYVVLLQARGGREGEAGGGGGGSIDNPSFLTVARISCSNLSLGGRGYYCGVCIARIHANTYANSYYVTYARVMIMYTLVRMHTYL